MLAVIHAGCQIGNAGRPVPERVFNLPVAVELSLAEEGEPPRFLFVANSNFNLRFSTGTVQTIDLGQIEAGVRACIDAGDVPCSLGTDRDPIDSNFGLAGYIVSEVAVTSHISDLAMSPRGDRIYASSRSDRNLAFLDLDPETGVLSCDQSVREGENVPRCDVAFREGDETIASARGRIISTDPTTLIAGRLEDVGGEPDSGDFVIMPTREGPIALFIDEARGESRRPSLVHVSGEIGQNLVSITLQPGTGTAWVAAQGRREISRVAVALDPLEPARSFLYDAGPIRLAGLADGEDARDIVFHPDGTRAFVLSRRPESVIAIDLDRRGLTPTDAAIWRVFDVCDGPARLALGQIGEPAGTFLFATCFDARQLFVFDLEHGDLVSVVGGFSGPFEMAVDEARELLYVGDFSTSVLRVVDLAPLARGEPARMVATLGELDPIRGFTGSTQ